jgi:hypothetical protein
METVSFRNVEVIAGAKHGFHDQIDQVIRLAIDWYRQHQGAFSTTGDDG